MSKKIEFWLGILTYVAVWSAVAIAVPFVWAWRKLHKGPPA